METLERSFQGPILYRDSLILGTLTTSGMYTIDVASGQSSAFEFDGGRTAARIALQYAGRSLVCWVENFDFKVYLIGEEGEITEDGLEDSLQFPNDHPIWAVDGPLFLRRGPTPNTAMISTDFGGTWASVESERGGDAWQTGRFVFYRDPRATHYRYCDSDSGARLMLSPVRQGGSPTTAAVVGGDTLLWLVARDGKQKLSIGKLGDTSSSVIDTIQINGIRRALRPERVFQLGRDRCLYLDVGGWTAIRGTSGWEAGSWSVSEGRIRNYNTFQDGRGIVYLQDRNRIATTLYRLDLREGLDVDSMLLPLGVQSTGLPVTNPSLLHMGVLLSDAETNQHLAVWDDKKVYALGSLVRELDVMPWNRMLHAWKPPMSGMLFTITELEQIVQPDTRGRGVVVRGNVFRRDDLEYPQGASVSNPDRHYREWGLSVPAQTSDGVMIPGQVVRQFDHTFSIADTIYHGPTSFASVLDKDVFATGWKNVLRIHRDAVVDTFHVNVPVTAIADSMGYPTAMTMCTDGSLVASFQGTWRVDSSTGGMRRYRWGGLLRSTNGGQIWKVVEMPDSVKTYVPYIMRTREGTLLATTMRMVEDSTPSNSNETQLPYSLDGITIIRSSDCGATWNEVLTPFYSGLWKATAANVVESSNGQLVAALTPGLFVSTDDGKSWRLDERLSALVVPISVSISNDNELLVAAHDGVYSVDLTTSLHSERELSDVVKTDSHRIVPLRSFATIVNDPLIENVWLYDIHGRMSQIKVNNAMQMNPLEINTPGAYIVFIDGRSEVLILHE
ncbi:MAG TPA: sialidase family protein [Candidatus Didemnitutus sp.]|nr:sialidase family protein [Candidatus Didemnitutus sp.]